MEQRLSYSQPTLSRNDVRGLLQTGEPPHVSIFLPTERTWNKEKENRLRLDNLLQSAQDMLQVRGTPNGDIKTLVQPISNVLEDDTFWREATDGLAFYAAQDHFSSHRLPYAVPEAAYVDQRFHIRPIWRHLEPNGRFYVLALSQDGVKLFRGFRYTLREIELTEAPTTLDEALQFDEHIRSVTFHTKAPSTGGGDRAEIYHGQEDAGDKAYVKEGVLRFFREVENEVTRLLRQETTPAPLVLAGIEVLRGLYRQVNHYAHVTETDLEGHHFDWRADAFDPAALHQGAWPIVEALFAQERADAEARYRQLEGTEEAADTIDTIVPAAYEHRIESLFVAEEETAWGRYDPTKRLVSIHSDVEPGDTELLNAIAAWTLEGDGDVFVVDPGAATGNAPAAAVLRY